MLWVAALLLTFSAPLSAGKKKAVADDKLAQSQYVRCIAFYNLENLFDTIHDEGKNDYEYLPDGGMKWNSYKYENKIKKMAEAVAALGTDYDPRGATCIGVAEVENIGCLEDLCAETNSKYGRRLKPILLEGPDRRGVDVGFLYDSVLFKPSSIKGYELKAHYADGGVIKTRLQLLVYGGRQAGEDSHDYQPLAQPLRRRVVFPSGA